MQVAARAAVSRLRRGRVKVTGRNDPAGYLLRIEDDGSGIDGVAEEGLGMRLIKSLASGLGDVSWSAGSGGAAVELRFRELAAKSV